MTFVNKCKVTQRENFFFFLLINSFVFIGTQIVCARCYTPVKSGVPWESHTPQQCSAAKELRRTSDHVARCTNHQPAGPGLPQPPRLLVGEICPTCSPNTTVRCIEPQVLRNISTSGKAPTVIIYIIGPNSEVCNLIDPGRCPNSECVCKKNENSSENIAQRLFWLSYTTSVRNSFDHNSVLSEPQTSDSARPDEDHDEDMADRCESDSDSEDECYDAQPLVRCYKMKKADFFAYAIANPPETVKPHTFLLEYLDEIIHFMKTSETLRNRENESFKMWIWAHTSFVDTGPRGADKNRDQFNKKKINTFNFMVPGFDGGLTRKILENAVLDLQNKFDNLNDQLAGSGWAFQKCTNIKICMGSIEHRFIEKTTSTGRILNGYVRYHQGFRGVGSTINFNYTGKGFRDKLDVCRDWDRITSPCVVYALKCYKICHDEELPDRDLIVRELLASECPKKYKTRTTDAVRGTPVVIPPDILKNGVQLRDLAALERANRIPIAVYYIRPPQKKKKRCPRRFGRRRNHLSESAEAGSHQRVRRCRQGLPPRSDIVRPRSPHPRYEQIHAKRIRQTTKIQK